MRKPIGALLALVVTSGCVRPSFGPRTIPAAHLGYNDAISRSWDEDLLLNVVRLQYRDSPLFVDVSSVTASYSLGRSASIGASGNGGGGSATGVSAGAGLAFNENPIIGYSYLHGEEFVQRLLSPLTPATLLSLSQSGWSVERLLNCCVQRINGVENAIAAAGPTPDFVPAYEPFQRVAALFRQLQLEGQLTAEQDATGHIVIYLKAIAGRAGDELRTLLSLDPSAERFDVVETRFPQGATQMAMQGRSLLAVMSFLAQAVEVPAADRASGKVTTTRDASGSEFDWARVLRPLMRIRSGLTPPDQAAVRVDFRGHWFWIDDNDLNSKTTFSLLRLLLFLKSGERAAQSPVVTIPAR